MRESTHPIPEYGVWHEAQPYPSVQSDLAFTPSSLTGDYVANDPRFAWRGTYYAQAVGDGNDRPNYDGWVTPFHIRRTKYKAHPQIRFDGDNPVFAWYNSDAVRTNQGFVVQSIHNAFTRGILRVQVDMRPPEDWSVVPDAYHTCFVFPVYGNYMDPLALGGNGEECVKIEGTEAPNITPGFFGFTSGYTSKKAHTTKTTFLRSYYIDPSTGKLANRNIGNSYSTTATPVWVRFVADYDLDRKTFSATAYKFSDATHPSLATETPATVYGSFADLAFTPLDGAGGAITGIGIRGNGVWGKAGTAATKVLVDNLRLSWKAPDADDYETFYENDFSTRRWKTVCAAGHGTTATGYAPKTVTAAVADVSTVPFTAMTAASSVSFATNSLVPAVSSSPSAAQPVGYDGWRRLPVADDATAYFAAFRVVNSQYDRLGDEGAYVYGSGGTYAALGSLGGASSQALVAHPIGETYTDGAVRLSVDVRLPALGTPAFAEGAMFAAVGLGSAALYSSPRASLAVNTVAGCGYERVKSDGAESHAPCVAASGSENGYARETPYTEPQDNYWHRMEVSVDLDAKTYGVAITPLSSISSDADFTPTNAPVYEKTGIAFASGAADVGTIWLRGFGHQPSMSLKYLTGRVCFDNIRVWRKAPGATEEKEVYSNDFASRVRASTESATAYARAAGYVADVFDRDDGPDHWLRRSVAGDEGDGATATVRDDGGNQYLALGRETEAGRRVQVSHSFGRALKRPFTFSVDMRPPTGWREKGGFALVSLGDAQMEQTEASEAIFDAHRQTAFGFTDADGSPECPWVRPYMLPVVRTVVDGVETDVPLCEASAISSDNWYRFKVRVAPEDGSCSVGLYDMGTAHPESSGASGRLIGSVGNAAFLNALADGDGISAFNIHAYGVGGAMGEAGVDADNVMVDNISAELASGLVITLR